MLYLTSAFYLHRPLTLHASDYSSQRKHRYQWQRWSQAQEFVDQPMHVDVRCSKFSPVELSMPHRKALRTTREQQW